MRHAAPRDNTLNRAGVLTLAAVTYTIAFASTALIALGSALAFWGLWQWLGVN